MPRVLLVEDNDGVAEMTTEILAAAGYAVQREITAYGAVAVARAEPPDVVLMDLYLRAPFAEAALVLIAQGVGPDAIEPFDATLRAIEARTPRGSDGVLAAAAMRGVGYAGPIVVVTGGVAPAIDADLASILGASVLLKPFRAEELLAELDKHLKEP
jgi:DNA-binding response OmpR family regulator